MLLVHLKALSAFSLMDYQWNLIGWYFFLMQYAANQKFGLCEALLKVGDWNHAKQLTKRLPEHCVLEQPPVARALCRLLHSVMEPVYRK
jgi:hypothetical protein